MTDLDVPADARATAIESSPGGGEKGRWGGGFQRKCKGMADPEEAIGGASWPAYQSLEPFAVWNGNQVGASIWVTLTPSHKPITH